MTTPMNLAIAIQEIQKKYKELEIMSEEGIEKIKQKAELLKFQERRIMAMRKRAELVKQIFVGDHPTNYEKELQEEIDGLNKKVKELNKEADVFKDEVKLRIDALKILIELMNSLKK
jgi:hypothetical protein